MKKYQDLYYLNREIDPKVMEKLVSFIIANDLNNPNCVQSNEFNTFLDISFKTKRESRPSVSQLSDFFKDQGSKIPGTIACRYAIELEKMARQNQISEFIV